MTLEFIKETIERHGLEFFGIAKLGIDELNFYRFQNWLKDKRHGSMSWLEKYSDIRRDSSQIDPKSAWAILLGVPYFCGDRMMFEPKIPPTEKSIKTADRLGLEELKEQENVTEFKAASFVKKGDLPQNSFRANDPSIDPLSKHMGSRVAQYARYQDYHSFTKKVGAKISLELSKILDVSGKASWRTVSDSIPLLERAIHEKFSLGFIGKNTMLIHPKKGSYFLLMEILTDLTLVETIPAIKTLSRSDSGGCGSCRRCQVYCPTGALDVDYQIDAKRCLSYLTIEHRGEIDLKFWPHFKKYWYGCDICQLVCPYNRKTLPMSPMRSRPEVEKDLAQVAMMSQKEYEEWFGGTPMTRAKRNGLRRNAIIAMAATNDPRLSEVIERLLSEADSVIRRTLAAIPAFQRDYFHAKQ